MMKTTVWFVAVLFACVLHESSSTAYEDCVDCICQVESNCRVPRPLCHRDGGSDSCGPYQIKYAYWLDARLRGGNLRGDWRTCARSPRCSRRAVRGYMDRYATRRRLGRQPTCEDWARIHNGGPNGYRRASTLAYWRRVQNCL
ncbi:lysozyme 1-like [Branchiostoma lanceolatum]|uniref:lysozyme 1-like n=1 Tax=Branchiostoma lanceolatum TaxID=7740 RepID=UPI003454CF61